MCINAHIYCFAAQVIELPPEFEPRKGKHERWTYQLLAESPALCEMARIVTSNCRALLARFLLEARQPLDVQWLIIFDSSGSMTTVQDGCAEALCVLVEALRRLECKFAIGALGDANRSRVLKPLDEPFSFRVGERILAGLTYNESTNTATGTKAITDKVFPSSQKRAGDERRVVVVITDGLCTQLTDKNFADIRQDHEAELAMLHLPPKSCSDKQSREIASTLELITNQLYFSVPQEAFNHEGGSSASDLMVVPTKLCELIEVVLKRVLHDAAVPKPGGGRDGEALAPEALMPPVLTHAENGHAPRFYPVNECVGALDLAAACREASGMRPRLIYSLSPPDAALEALQYITRRELEALRPCVDDVAGVVGETMEINQRLPRELPEATEAAWRAWDEASVKLRAGIVAMSEVLEEAVFPNNKYTRRRADFKGSQLHLPGLIKAVCTDFSYKRYLSARKAGGQRAYGVCLALDVSQSMQGHLLGCAVEALVMLIQALIEVSRPFRIVLRQGGDRLIVRQLSQGVSWGALPVL
jgi:uncharacterized protein YegL